MRLRLSAPLLLGLAPSLLAGCAHAPPNDRPVYRELRARRDARVQDNAMQLADDLMRGRVVRVY
jgi:hypothetical protein